MDFLKYKEQSTALIEDLILWTRCVASPAAAAREVLNSELDDRTKMRISLRILLTALAISFVLQLPVHSVYGFKIEFYLFGTLTSALSVYLMALMFYFGFRIFRIRMKFVDVFICYTIVIGTYTPAILFTNYAGNIATIEAVKKFKEKNLTFRDGVVDYFISISSNEPNELASWLINLSTLVLFFLSMILLVIFSNVLTKWYDLSKSRTYSSVTFSLMVLSFPILIVTGIINMYALYAMMKS